MVLPIDPASWILSKFPNDDFCRLATYNKREQNQKEKKLKQSN